MQLNAGTVYIIVNHNTGTVLDCNEGNGWVRAWGKNDGDNQKWELNREGRGHPWTLRNVATGKYLAAEEPFGGEAPGHALKHIDEPYLWHIADAEEERGHRIQVPENHDLNIDVENAERGDDVKIVLWHQKGDNQVWHFEEA